MKKTIGMVVMFFGVIGALLLSVLIWFSVINLDKLEQKNFDLKSALQQALAKSDQNSINLSALMGSEFIRVCWVEAQYDYAVLPDVGAYFDSLLGVDGYMPKLEMYDGESGYAVLLLLSDDGRVVEMPMLHPWRKENNVRGNWCAMPADVTVQVDDGFWIIKPL